MPPSTRTCSGSAAPARITAISSRPPPKTKLRFITRQDYQTWWNRLLPKRPSFVTVKTFVLPLLFSSYLLGLSVADSSGSLGLFDGSADVGAVLHAGTAGYDPRTKVYTVTGRVRTCGLRTTPSNSSGRR